MNAPLTPRRWAAVAAVLCVLLGATGCGVSSSSSSSSSGPIKVGFVVDLTGPFAANGSDLVAGWKLGLKDAGATIGKRQIQTTYADDATDPSIGLTATRNLIQKNVDLLVGPVAANIGLAIRAPIVTSGIPTVYPSACPDELATKDKANNLILTGWTCDQPSLNFGKYVYQKLGIKHLTTVGLDYAFGWQVIGGFLADYKAAGGTVDKQIWAPISTTDFSTYVSQIPTSTQAVFALMAGAPSVRFTQAYQSLGLKSKIPLIGGGTLTDYSAMRSESPANVLGAITTLQYADGLDTAANKKFVSEYKSATGKLPSYYAESGYATAKLVVAALRKVGGNASNKTAVINALKSTTFQAPRGTVKIDPSTNSPVQNIYVRKVEMVNGALRNVVIATFSQVPPWGSMSQSQWQKLACCYTRSTS